MTYATTNPPRLVSASIDAAVPSIWMYSSTDVVATVAAANYITNAKDLGMKVNDMVIVVDTTTPKISSCQVTAVASTGSTLSSGSQIS